MRTYYEVCECFCMNYDSPRMWLLYLSSMPRYIVYWYRLPCLRRKVSPIGRTPYCILIRTCAGVRDNSFAACCTVTVSMPFFSEVLLIILFLTFNIPNCFSKRQVTGLYLRDFFQNCFYRMRDVWILRIQVFHQEKEEQQTFPYPK